MRIFKSKAFSRWAAKEGLTDKALVAAVTEMEDGLIDIDLGGNVYKKRIAIEGQGKSAGLRTALAFRVGNKSFFMFSFAKNQQANVNNKELRALKLMAKSLLGYADNKLNDALNAGELVEVDSDG
jgi:hypothetical protein